MFNIAICDDEIESRTQIPIEISPVLRNLITVIFYY